MKFSLNMFSPRARGVIPLYLFSLLSILPQINAAKFDAESFFIYIDQSCKDLAAVNNAGEEMNFLVRSTLSEGFNFDSNDVEGGRAGRAFNAWWGKLDSAPSVTDPTNTQEIKDRFGRLGDNMPAKQYGIYCDGSAFEFITNWPADTPTGDGWGTPGDPIDGGGAWYIKDPTRRVPGGDYLAGAASGNAHPAALGDDICAPKDQGGKPKGIAGASLPGANYIIVCPSAFTVDIGDQLATFGKTAEPDGDDLDWFASSGATMLHEFTHAVLETEDEEYDSENCINLATKEGPEVARTNADSYMSFALASYLNQNEWINGGASSPLQAAVNTRNNRQRIKHQNLFANETSTASTSRGFPNSTTLSASVSGSTSSKSSSPITTSARLNSTTSASKTSTIGSTSKSVPGTSSTGSFTSVSSTSSSSSSTVQTETTKKRSSSSSLSSSSSSRVTTSLSSLSSEDPFTWSGSWSDTTTPTPVSPTWLDLPTGTVAPSEQTSDAVLVGGLFFALKNNRHWMTDPKLKSQYVNNVKKVKDQTLALFNKLDLKPPEPDCSSSKRKRGDTRMSERQLRSFLRERASLQDRSIFSGVANVIKDAVHDVAKLLSCAVNVVNNLVDSVDGNTPDIGLIQDLTDSLAAVGEAMDEEPEDEPTNTSPTSTEASKTSSSSSSSSCSASTAIPICTQTVILSTSYISGRSTFTVDSTTTTKCSTTTIGGCTGAG